MWWPLARSHPDREAYCSVACRRMAELEIKRINRCLEVLEGRLSDLHLQGDSGLTDLADGTTGADGRTLKKSIAAKVVAQMGA